MSKSKVTLRSLALELKIAPATVLRALTDHPNVTLELRRKVIALAQLRHYSLPTHSPKLIAVIIPGFEFDGYSGQILADVMTELEKKGWQGEIISFHNLDILQDHVYAGAISIVWNGKLAQSWSERFSMPLVTLNAPGNPREGIAQITSDERQGINLGMTYLYARQCRSIALLLPSCDLTNNNLQRQSCFLEFCREYNISDWACVRAITPQDSIASVVAELTSQRIEAILVASETLAPQVLYELRQLGKRVPADIALLALENKHISPYTDPPLTALTQDFAKLAQTAVAVLQRRIAHLPVQDVSLVPYRFIERHSC